MTIKTISYQKAFVIGPYLQERIGVEIDLSDTDDPDKAFQLAKEMTEDFHKKANPHLEGTTVTDVPMAAITVDRNDPKAALIADIHSCTEVKVLETYRLLVKGNKELQDVYDKKLAELEK